MKRRLKKLLRRAFFESQRVMGLDKQAVMLGQIRAKQIFDQGQLEKLSDAEISVFSQWGEDGIISWLVDRIEPETHSFVEFGVEDFREANMRYLQITRNWKGLIIDGSDKNIESIKKEKLTWSSDFTAVASFITKDNISNIIADAGMGKHVGILSVDIDGVDYWVLEQIDVTADIVIVEYNGSLDPAPISVAYDPSFVHFEKHYSRTYWGASLSAFRHLLENREYVFVGTNNVGTNAFFVSQKHIGKIKMFLKTFTAHSTTIRDSRKPDGSLSLKSYAFYHKELSNFDYVNVETGLPVKGSDIFSAKSAQ